MKWLRQSHEFDAPVEQHLCFEVYQGGSRWRAPQQSAPIAPIAIAVPLLEQTGLARAGPLLFGRSVPPWEEVDITNELEQDTDRKAR
jgi:hypothetical protein